MAIKSPAAAPRKAAKKSVKKAAKKAARPAAAAKSADWTILVYMAGDNDLDDFGGDDIQEMKRVGSSDKLHIIVQRDTAAAGVMTQRLRLCQGTAVEADVVEEIGETNTGDPAVLEEFLDWGLKEYPAKRTMAVLWNHGSGWDDTDIYAEARRRGLRPPEARPAHGMGVRRSGTRGRLNLPGGFIHRSVARRRFRGPFFLTAFQVETVAGKRRAIAFDDNAQDFLDSVEMKNVFHAVTKGGKRKFDVIGMDACLMSMVETAIQVQGAGRYFCGSQEVEPGEGWPYDRVLEKLAATTMMDGLELTKIIVEEFVDSYPAHKSVTQSAFELSKLATVQKAANALGSALAKAYTTPDFARQGVISDARRRAQGYEHPDYVDLVDFCDCLDVNLPESKKLTSNVRDAVGACVYASSAIHPDVARSHGLSIYLPNGSLSPLYAKLDFAGGGWGEFLKARNE
ncbi:clostripain-related cysteine peptidase [Verrucomicrobium sp. BvORR034]|uniref:clostripain-related cysteine peptidase n=1 Tax=Verrucomicrobium sp. BvORR034 TaxID=1396418 RepID=UPI0006791BD7|nr:clostripain-related cysteine peptidase [Verrucomicrobium sp. BvORR034]